MNSINPIYRTYRPDVLVKNEYTSTYRLTTPEWNGSHDDSPFNVVFRPKGRDKELQISVNCGYMDLNGETGQAITVSSQVVDFRSRKVKEERLMYKGFVNYQNLHCPMCGHGVIWNNSTSRWLCTSTLCGFDYSQQSCAELDKIYTDAVRGLNNPRLLGVLANTQDNLQITHL